MQNQPRSSDINQVVPNVSSNTTPKNQYSCKHTLSTFLPVISSSKIVQNHNRTVSDCPDLSVQSNCTPGNQSSTSEFTRNAAFIQSTGTLRGDSVLNEEKSCSKSSQESELFYGSYLDCLKNKASHQKSLNGSGHKNNGSSLDTVNETENTGTVIEYSCADMTSTEKSQSIGDDKSLAEEDDASSTSGSYIVDPQELCQEIDDLFFKDSTIKT